MSQLEKDFQKAKDTLDCAIFCKNMKYKLYTGMITLFSKGFKFSSCGNDTSANLRFYIRDKFIE